MSNKLKASVTVVINSIAQSKKAAGVRVYNLSAGEPKLKTPEIVREAAIKFIEAGDVPYPSPSGEVKLRKAACEWMNRLYGCSYSVDEAILTTGGKFGIYLLLQYLLGNNSPFKIDSAKDIGVIIPAPYWVSYPAITTIMGGKSVVINTTEESGWKLTPEMLRAVYTRDCRILMLNNGVNPTGAIYTRAEMQKIMDTANELELLVISDEVYSSLIYTDDEYVSCGSFPEYKENVIVIQSTSKAFAMTGWRVGFLFGRKDIIDVMAALTSQSTTGVSLVCQHGAISALEHADQITAWVNAQMKERRDILVKAFKEHFAIDLAYPKATLYAWTSLESLGVKNMSDEDFCVQALEEANVATVPGSGFGQPGYVRFSFAAEADDLVGGISSLAMFIKKLNSN